MGRVKDFIRRVLAENMAKQARQVEIMTLIVFLLLLGVVWWLWIFQLAVAVPVGEGEVEIVRLNIFELLLSKK